MYPVLFRLRLAGGLFELHSFGVLVAAGCAAGIVWALREADRLGEDRDAIRDLCFWTIVAGLVGARLTYVALGGRAAWDDCVDGAVAGGIRGALSACTRPLRLWEGGLVFYGGVASGAAAALAFARRRKLRFARTADILSPSLALGHAIGRIGCFLAGCCFGKSTDSAFGLRFPEGSAAFADLFARGLLPSSAIETAPLHPTQIYEAAGELAIFFLLYRVARTRFAHVRDGRLTLVYLIAYSTLRFGLEMFRGDTVRRFVHAFSTPGWNRLLGLPDGEPSFLSTSQAIALGVIGACVLLLQRKNATRAAEPVINDA